jgi:two-component system NtrC family sensor kinase
VPESGDTLKMVDGKSAESPEGLPISGSDEPFQNLLVRIAAKAAERSDHTSLIQVFCHATREFFQVSGVYFWRRLAGDELLGEQGEGTLAERFMGLRLLPQQSAVTTDAVRRRRTIFANQAQMVPTFPASYQFGARSLMAAPVVAFDEVIGVATLLHDSDEEFFNDDLAAKATILAGQLGSLLEASRRGEASQENSTRADVPDEVAHVSLASPNVLASPDVSAVIEALADRLRLLLRSRLVSVLLRGNSSRDSQFELQAVAAETPTLASAFRAAHDRQSIRVAADLAQRAVSAGEPILVSISTGLHSLGGLVFPGMLMVTPFRTARTQGAIFVYPRQEGPFTADEKSLVSSMAGFGAVALAHAELSATSQVQANELQQLLDILSEFASGHDLDNFLQQFVTRAAPFLGFGRCFIALEQDGQFRLRYAIDHGQPHQLDLILPEGSTTRAMRAGEIYSTDEPGKAADLSLLAEFRVRQMLAVPLTSPSGEVLGMFAAIDRLDGAAISPDDIRRARPLAAQASVALEAALNAHQSELNRKRSEALTQMERELSQLPRLPDFARKFIERASELADAQSGALIVFQDARAQTVILHQQSPSRAPEPSVATAPRTEDRALQAQLLKAIADLVSRRSDAIITGSAAEILGSELATALGWNDLVMLRLASSSGELIGLLCLTGLNRPLFAQSRGQGQNTARHDAQTDARSLLTAIAARGATLLENARLFTRIEQANRHWMEIFDAMSDFIVVHDEADKVLRVNRSLAAMIGVAPSELIGVNMRALLALTNEGSLYSCPFCRSMAEDSDEFVHPALDRTYLVSTSRIHGASGEHLQTIHVLKDITDRREAERRYRELFDNIQEGLFFSTPEGRFVEVNDAMVNMFGYDSREELLQVDIPSQIYFSAEQRQHHADALEKDGHMRNYEATLRRKNGSPIYVLINAFGMYDNLGRLLQIRGLMLDVTGLHKFQSELQRERDFSGKILSNTQSLILVADTAGLISYANRRWYEAGFEQNELLGRPLLELAAPGFVRPLADALQAILRGGQVDNLELQVMRGNGHVGQFSVNLSPMRDEQGSVNSIVVVMTDITDSSDLRDKLVHAEKMAAVGQLVAGVAHEVNNPLTAILGFADLLLENSELPETARKDLRVILQEAQRTKQIVQNLLSFARQMPPQRNAVQINLIIRRTTQLRSYDFNSHGIDVVEHLDEGLPDIIGDAHQLQQVFLNILNNAYDAVHELGRPARIEIMTTKIGDAVEVSFRDNGHGVSNPDRIFDPFFTTKEVGKGTGLGLSICYGIVKEHGGEILCHNNADGHGATFIVRFPSAPQSATFSVAAGVNQP